MADYAFARRAMVDQQIATSAVTSPRLLSALRRVPRELFVPIERRPLAYSDAHHPLGNGRFLPAPATFARLVQLADITDRDRVLDYWSATGYSTAVLAAIAQHVEAFEPDGALAEACRRNAVSLGLSNVSVSTEVTAGPFDAIVVEGAVDRVPEALLSGLAMNGRLVCLIRNGPTAVATRIVRTETGLVTKSCFNATLPVLPAAPEPENFVF